MAGPAEGGAGAVLPLPPTTPAPVAECVRSAAQRLEDAYHPLRSLLADTPEFAPALTALCAGSDWAVDWLARHPEVLPTLTRDDLYRTRPTARALEHELDAALAAAGPDEALRPDGPVGTALRTFRNRHMVGVLLRDLSGHADLEETVAAVSDLAEVVLGASLARAEQAAVETWGVPVTANGTPVRMLVLAMGKLGARELNLSSDVDLVFACTAPGETPGGLPAREFFTRVGQRLIGLLDPRTPAGFVFRVDLRLRPFGEAGPVVQHADALVAYYEEQGREWERYALIKARPVAGDLAAGEALLQELRPFVFRRYLDFGAIEALRGMKRLIRQEVRRRRLDDDVKLGEGGIREVEFVAQVFQLIHGGRDRRFQTRALRSVLRRLEEAGYLPEADRVALDEAYVFLRHVEHRIQALRDEQTQRLPADAATRERIAFTLGAGGWAGCAASLAAHRERVSLRFSELIREPEAEETEDVAGLEDWVGLWRHPEEPAAREQLAAAGFADPASATALLVDLRRQREEAVTQDVGRARLDAALPRLLAAAAAHEDPDLALARTLPLVEAVLRRTAYLVLLVENPPALAQLVRLAAASERIAASLARHPILLDELLDPRHLFTAPEPASVRAELAEQLRGVEHGDLEREMEQLRYFKEATELRVAACEYGEILPIMKVSDALTWLAEAILERVVALAWEQTAERLGCPRDAGGRPREDGFCVVAYGKFGGFELGWGSDLDLVFLHQLPLDGTTEGPREVANGQFFARLGQRIVHLLTTRTHTGVLYEVDVRLRPSGQAGLLVTPLDAFGRYQHEEAWTWEHQALVRARPVVGDPAIREAFEAVRREVLGRPRERAALRGEIAAMRARMLAGLRGLRERPPASALGDRTELDLKQDPGAVVDIEFMVQYLVLGWAHARPGLLAWTDAIRTLETARDAGIVTAGAATFLIDSYKEFRAEAHRTALANRPARTTRPELVERANRVAGLWDTLLVEGQDI